MGTLIREHGFVGALIHVVVYACIAVVLAAWRLLYTVMGVLIPVAIVWEIWKCL